MSNVRTPDGYKANTGPLAGVQEIVSPGPADVEVVQFVSIDNQGGAAALVANLPRAQDLYGRGLQLYTILAGAGVEAVTLTPQAGETVNGGASLSVTAAASSYLVGAPTRDSIVATVV